MSTPTISDEEIYRRKLLMDGEGMGDDKRINLLFKNLCSCCELGSESLEERLLLYSRVMTALESCQVAVKKSAHIQKVNKQEAERYEELYRVIETGITQIQKDIEEKKVLLQRSKLVRRNQRTYNNLVTAIKAQPDRKVTLEKLESVEKEIENLEKKKEKLTKQLDNRSKLMHALGISACELVEITKGDEKGW